MIKRLNKAKKNKQGAILVIVVLILALAMIFIAMKEDIIELYESFKGTDYARDES